MPRKTRADAAELTRALQDSGFSSWARPPRNEPSSKAILVLTVTMVMTVTRQSTC